MENMKNNAIGWVEVPVTDMERAVRFYESVFGFKMERHLMGPLEMAWFPWIEGGLGTSGSLVYHKDSYKPSQDGVLIYFTAHSGDLQNELDRVEKVGGKVLQSKTLITEEIGYMGLIVDTEGNRIGIHSRK